MTYTPILSDQEADLIKAALDLVAKTIGAQLQQQGLAITDAATGKLNAVKMLSEKIAASHVEPAQAVADGTNGE